MIVLLALVLSFIAGGEVAVTPVDPSAYPYVVKVDFLGIPEYITEPALMVSARYILASKTADTEPAALKITDQAGKVRSVFKVTPILDGVFTYTYLKVCDKFNGRTYPMTASSYNDLSSDVPNSEMLFYYNNSHVLQKVPATVMSTANCTISSGGSINETGICVYQDTTPGFCSFLSNSSDIMRWPLLSINGQPQGFLEYYGCDATMTVTDDFDFNNIGYYRSDIIDVIPLVTIK
ncbi:uncharacterized protein LOC135940513 [Cloeon dipterum]|uniref:uncharacterized protein LOC135940513 n=1 Tax=Cloeon dipterum TaxID=197152 RepID=UPI00322074AB